MNKRISVNLALAIAILCMTVTFVVTMILSQNLFDKTVSSVRDKEIMYDKIADIDKTVRADYYGEINNDTLYDMISAGYLQGIGDAQARYYTSKRYLEYVEEQSGKVVGVGVDVVKDNAAGYARVIRVYTDSPAENAGIQKNWFITKVNDVDVKSLTVDQVSSALKGEQGTTVTIVATNASGEEQEPISLQRQQYDKPSVEYELPEGKTTGYVQINTFTSQTSTELQYAIDQMLASDQGLDALVLDVRNNTGGALAAAIKAVDVLCPAGAVASQKNKDGTVDVLGTSDIKEVDLPMVVLVNSTTAFGAELFATSIRDFGKGIVVGSTTAGKGSIQCEPVRLSDGSAISYTVGMLLTKTGASFDGVGVVPDVESTLRADEEANFYNLTVDTDSQINKAFEAAQQLVTNPGSIGQTTTSNATSAETGEAEPPASAPAEGEPAVDDASTQPAA